MPKTPLSIIKIAIEEARMVIATILDDKVKIVQNVASALQSIAQGQIFGSIVRTVKHHNQDKKLSIQLEHIQRIHAHEEHGVNTNGHGVLVSNIYEGDDGSLYKQTGDRWYYWNGSEWKS